MIKEHRKLIGPFSQILTLANLPLHGTLADEAMTIIRNGGIAMENGIISAVDNYRTLAEKYPGHDYTREQVAGDIVLLPGLIDAHTHLCYAGSRANDFALRIAGISYLEIARQGGGIWQTVQSTREETSQNLEDLLIERVSRKLTRGVTTIEIKSGYGLNAEQEIRHLEIIKQVDRRHTADLVPTCLAAHLKPRDFPGNNSTYLEYLVNDLLPEIKRRNLASRIDIFVEASAFTMDEARTYLTEARRLGFDLVMHADQFTKAGSHLAAEMGILSADHLEVSGEPEIQALQRKGVICTALPGSSIGLGHTFAPARKILDANACLVIATDQNPGSAPQGDLLTQASILATFEKLSSAEVFAGITFRAAAALRLPDRGVIQEGKLADFVGFPTADYREILYQQGNMGPSMVWKNGERLL
jgi:imidazolonepropionase